MLSIEQAYYQTWLILEGLSKEERELICPSILEQIKNNMKVDESIRIDFSIPLEKQKIDPKTWSILKKILKHISSKSIDKKTDDDSYHEKVKNLLMEYKKAFEDTLKENQLLKKNNRILEEKCEKLKTELENQRYHERKSLMEWFPSKKAQA